MANLCCFTMKIVGKKENVEEFTKMMKREGEFKENGLGRVYDFDITEPDQLSDGTLLVLGSGSCAWSVWCAMMQEYRSPRPSLESESKRLDLVMEVFSEEPGCAFQEHYFLNKGILETDETEEYHEFWKEGYDEEDWNDVLKENELTEEDLNEDGFIAVGGFENYCEFDAMDEYLKNIGVEIEEPKENSKYVTEKGQRWLITFR